MNTFEHSPTISDTSEVATDSESLCQLLKAAGDELRLAILRVLYADSFGVLELCQIFGSKQSGMSHHLKVLAKAGLVSSRREGNSIFYRRKTVSSDETHASLSQSLFESVNKLPLKPDVQSRLNAVNAQRAQASRDFFQEHAHSFKEQQELIAKFDSYGPQVDEVVGQAGKAFENALEIGPGEGEFLPFLSKRFNQVTALDNSAAMLEKTAHTIQHKQLGNVETVLGDSGHCSVLENSQDCVVINMVLHHTPSPNQILADASRSLKDGGILIVCELCQHEQEWAKEACGDLWLGFEPSELVQWASDAQLINTQSQYIALRNGFQLQIQTFAKRSTD